MQLCGSAAKMDELVLVKGLSQDLGSKEHNQIQVAMAKILLIDAEYSY